VLTDLSEGSDRSEQGKGADAANVSGEWFVDGRLSYCEIFRCGGRAGTREDAFLGNAGGRSLLLLLLLSSNRPPAEIWSNRRDFKNIFEGKLQIYFYILNSLQINSTLCSHCSYFMYAEK
jgi:hypothetical protein